VHEFNTELFSLTGVLMLSYFIHNGALSIMRNGNQKTNSTDMTIAFSCVCATYLLVAVCFFVSFDGGKEGIKQNFLQNFVTTDGNYIFAFVAEIFVFLQLITVFPLLLFIVRATTFSTIYNGNVYPSLIHVIVLNLMALTAGVMVAIYYPNIGSVLQYTGAVCGGFYVYALPLLVRRAALKKQNKYTLWASLPTYGFLGFGVRALIFGRGLVLEDCLALCTHMHKHTHMRAHTHAHTHTRTHTHTHTRAPPPPPPLPHTCCWLEISMHVIQ
jgi:sodium-coupled neutral amino acid transporter 9